MLEPAFIVAFIVYFIRATLWKGMIFYYIKKKLSFLPSYIRKPLYECPVCMTPWWGTVIYLIAHFSELPGFKYLSLPFLIFTVFTASGIITVFVVLYKIYKNLSQEED